MEVTRQHHIKPLSWAFVDITNPAAYGRVTLSDGQPSSGIHLGSLAKGIKWTPSYNITPDEVENYAAPVGYDKDNTGLRMSILLKEITGHNLALSNNGKLIIHSDGTTSVRIGTGNPLDVHSWCIVWERKAGSRLFEQAVVYEGFVESASEVSLDRSDYTVLALEIVAQVAQSRPEDDNLGYNTSRYNR